MNAFEHASQVVALIQQASIVIEKLLCLAHRFQPLVGGRELSYENLLLDLTLDIEDETGHRATIKRTQRVRFLADEAGVLRSSVWGEGNQFKRLRLIGAKRLARRMEGSREVVLLGLDHPVRKGSVVGVQTSETVIDALLREQEYFESAVERPTRRLRMRVLFPKNRSPRSAYLHAGFSHEQHRLPTRRTRNGRPTLSWSIAHAEIDTVYGLRWAW